MILGWGKITYVRKQLLCNRGSGYKEKLGCLCLALIKNLG